MARHTQGKRLHRMPFGADLVEGGVRFRLWAPSAKSVDVVLYAAAHGHAQSSHVSPLAIAAAEGRAAAAVPGSAQSPESTHALAMSTQPDGWFELITNAARAGTRYRFRIDGGLEVPDPAARANDDVYGASVVVDPLAHTWHDTAWRGRPWHEAALYELHVGTFTPEGTFAGVESRLDYLVTLGITVIELMPIGEFPGTRGWGYDGVLLYSPDASYGTPESLKSLIDAAHHRGLAVMLDVVYNHFGPEGNWLHTYAPQFFTEHHHTPWGAAINFSGPSSRTVRDFFIHNALYWLEEYHFDGLRLDAIHAMHDDSERHFITELTQTVRNGPGKERDVYIVLENGANQARFLGNPPRTASPATHSHGLPERAFADAQWNDDVHHCLHVILTGETDGYYADYADHPHAMLCRGLAEGFVYQGERSQHEGGEGRGEPSAHLTPSAFVNFLQNHDQIGNRAFGERLSALVLEEAALFAASAVLLLAPSPPMLFMGEEWGAPEPFVYFCDFGPELAEKIREGRQREFARFRRFSGETGTPLPPDPSAPETFQAAKLDWKKLEEPRHARWLEHYRRLLAIRQRDIAPRIPEISPGRCVKRVENGAFAVDWAVSDGSVLHLIANLNNHRTPIVGRASGRAIYATHPNIRSAVKRNSLEPWSVTWLLERTSA